MSGGATRGGHQHSSSEPMVASQPASRYPLGGVPGHPYQEGYPGSYEHRPPGPYSDGYRYPGDYERHDQYRDAVPYNDSQPQSYHSDESMMHSYYDNQQYSGHHRPSEYSYHSRYDSAPHLSSQWQDHADYGNIRHQDYQGSGKTQRPTLQEEQYWFNQRRQKQPFTSNRDKTKSVPTSPTRDAHHPVVSQYGPNHLLEAQPTSNFRSNSAEGHCQESSHWQQHRRGSWDGPPRAGDRDQSPHQRVTQSPRAHGWPEVPVSIDTQPHGWGSGHHRPHSQSPRQHRDGSPRKHHTSLPDQPLSDWTYNTSYEPRTAPSSEIPVHHRSQAPNESRQSDQAHHRDRSSSHNAPEHGQHTKIYKSTHHQHRPSYEPVSSTHRYSDNRAYIHDDSYRYADPTPVTDTSSEYPSNQYNEQTYQLHPQEFSITFNPQDLIQPRAPDPKTQDWTSGRPQQPDQYNREYDLYADPDQVRQLKTSQRQGTSPDSSIRDKYNRNRQTREDPRSMWAPQNADQLRKQFTSSAPERETELDTNKHHYTQFFITASPDSSIARVQAVPSQLVSNKDSAFPIQKGHPQDQRPRDVQDTQNSVESERAGCRTQFEKIMADIKQKYEEHREPSPKPKKQSQSVLHFHLQTESKKERPLYVVKGDDQPEEVPPVNISAIKENLFREGEKGDDRIENQKDVEVSRAFEKRDRKVSELKAEIFSGQDEIVPNVQVLNVRPSSKHFDQESDERIVSYASYKDNLKPRRSAIQDELTDLERTYEQLNLNNEDVWEQALNQEVSKAGAGQELGNVRRLSITNLRKLETLQQHENTPSMDYARSWLANDGTPPPQQDAPNQRNQSTGDDEVFKPHHGAMSPESAEVSQYSSNANAPHQIVPEAKKTALSSGVKDTRRVTTSGQHPVVQVPLPRKVGDDMAFRRQKGTGGSTSKPSVTSVGSFLASSPGVTPATSVDSLPRRSHSQRARRSMTPDPVQDDVVIRCRQRLASSDAPSAASPVSPSPTSTDYLRARETAPARGRMRSRPDSNPDKYHDDYAYRHLRKDVPPVKVELPRGYIEMKQQLSLRPRRTQSLDRVDQRNSAPQNDDQRKHQRSASIGEPSPALNSERKVPLARGIAKMVDLFSSTLKASNSAPDLTDQSVFAETYNDQGEIASDDSKQTGQSQRSKQQVSKQILKQQTPRIVKQRNEFKSRLKTQTQKNGGPTYTESESEAYSSSYSSSVSESNQHSHRSPPDGATYSDETDGRRHTDVQHHTEADTQPKSFVTTGNSERLLQNHQPPHPSIALEKRRVQDDHRDSIQPTRHEQSEETLVKTRQIPITRIPHQEPPNKPEEVQRHAFVPYKREQHAVQHHIIAVPKATHVAKETIHLHKLGTARVKPEPVITTVKIAQAESKVIPAEPASLEAAPKARASIIKKQSELMEKLADTEKEPLKFSSASKGKEGEEPLTVLDQWKVQAEQRKMKQQEQEEEERLEQEKQKYLRIQYEQQQLKQQQFKLEQQHRFQKQQHEKQKQMKQQRIEREREIVTSTHTTKIERKVCDKTDAVKEEHKVTVLSQGHKLQKQVVALKGQKIDTSSKRIHLLEPKRRLRPGQSGFDTLDVLVASQPIASDIELDFSDYDNLETSDPGTGSASDSDDSQKGVREQNKKHTKSSQGERKPKSSETKTSARAVESKASTQSTSKGLNYERTEIQETEIKEKMSADGSTSVAKESSSVVTESTDNKDNEEEGGGQPRLGRRPSFKDIVQSFEAKAPTFMRGGAMRKCSSQDSVHQDDPAQSKPEPLRLKDMSGSESSLQNNGHHNGNQRGKPKHGIGYYDDRGTPNDPATEF